MNLSLGKENPHEETETDPIAEAHLQRSVRLLPGPNSCSVASGFVLRFQHIDVTVRAFSHATVSAFLIGSHILRDLAIRTAMGIGDITLPRILRSCLLCVAPTSLHKHHKKQERQSCNYSF